MACTAERIAESAMGLFASTETLERTTLGARQTGGRVNLERAAELVPGDAVVFEHLGDVYAALGRTREAREFYERALDLEGENRTQVKSKLRGLRVEP